MALKLWRQGSKLLAKDGILCLSENCPCEQPCDRILAGGDGAGSADDWLVEDGEDLVHPPSGEWTFPGHLHWEPAALTGGSGYAFGWAQYSHTLETYEIAAKCRYSTNFEPDSPDAFGLTYMMGLSATEGSRTGLTATISYSQPIGQGYTKVYVKLLYGDPRVDGVSGFLSPLTASLISYEFFTTTPELEVLQLCITGHYLTLKTNSTDGVTIEVEVLGWGTDGPFEFWVGAALQCDVTPVVQPFVDFDDITLSLSGDACEPCDVVCRYCNELEYPEEGSLDLGDVWAAELGDCSSLFPTVPSGSYGLDRQPLRGTEDLSSYFAELLTMARRIENPDGTVGGDSLINCPPGVDRWDFNCSYQSASYCQWHHKFETTREWPGSGNFTDLYLHLVPGTVFSPFSNVHWMYDNAGTPTEYKYVATGGAVADGWLYTGSIPLLLYARLVGYTGDIDVGTRRALVHGATVVGTGISYAVGDDPSTYDPEHGVIPAIRYLYNETRPQIDCGDLTGKSIPMWYAQCCTDDQLPGCGPLGYDSFPPSCYVKRIVIGVTFADSESPCYSGPVEFGAQAIGGIG